MANTVNVTSDILAQSALEGFLSVIQPLNIFSTDFSPAPMTKGATVSVPLYSTIPNADTFAGDYTTNSDQTIGEVAVALDQHFYKTVNVSDIDVTKGIDGQKLAFHAGKAVAMSVFTGALGQLNLTRAPGGANSQTLSDAAKFAPSGVLALRDAAAAWPERNMLVDSSYYTALLGNLPSNTTVQNNATSNGTVPSAYGFNIYETNVSPVCQGHTGAKVIASHPSALAIASRYLAPDDGGQAYIDARPVTDDKTKITLGTRTWYDPSKGKRFFMAEWNGGYKVGVTGAVAFINET